MDDKRDHITIEPIATIRIKEPPKRWDVLIGPIAECKTCGADTDMKGYNGQCVACGAQNDDWYVKCPCGEDRLWEDEETLTPYCPSCGTDSNDYVVTHYDSAFLINELLHSPELHKERWPIPASFVQTLLDFLQKQK